MASRRSAPSGHVATTTTTQKWGSLFKWPKGPFSACHSHRAQDDALDPLIFDPESTPPTASPSGRTPASGDHTTLRPLDGPQRTRSDHRLPGGALLGAPPGLGHLKAHSSPIVNRQAEDGAEPLTRPERGGIPAVFWLMGETPSPTVRAKIPVGGRARSVERRSQTADR